MSPDLEDALRLAVPGALALLAAFALDRMTAARGLTPPGFRQPWRRVAAFFLMTIVFWVGITGPLGDVGRPVEVDVTQLTTPQLFLLHAVMIVVTLSWFALGFAGVREERSWIGEAPALTDFGPPAETAILVAAPAPPPPPASVARQLALQFGFVAPNIPREIGLGLLLGIAAWAAVFVAVILFALLIYFLGGEEALPKQPPALVPWIAGLPILVRLLISLSAGVVEEWFFRGFLQPRMGILLSTGFFVLAHFSYGQPFMLIGIAVLSLIYGLLVKWRQNIWPAIAAHALFDGVQLLVIIPLALRYLGTQGAKTAALLALLGF